jgi:hypothetical protein
MRTHILQDKISETTKVRGTAGSEAKFLDTETGKWYYIEGVEEYTFTDQEGSVTIVALQGRAQS